MYKKLLYILLSTFIVTTLQAQKVSKDQCDIESEEFIFAGGECINFNAFEGDDNKDIIVVIHGTWPEGTNILGRYNTFAETLNMNTDKTTIAVALPGYSKSSTNNLLSIDNKVYKHQASNKAYVKFLGDLMKGFKEKFEAETITFVGHSAGARLGAVLAGSEPSIFKNVVLVGGRYERKDKDPSDTILPSDVLPNMSKDAKFIMVYGTADKVSEPKVTTSFYDKMKTQGLNVELVKVEGAGHQDLDMTDPAIEAIGALFEE